MIDVGAKTVVLERTQASARPGVYGLVWSGGHGVLGAILDESESTVTRELTARTGPLDRNQKVGIDPNVWESDPREALDIPFRTVQVPSQLGPLPAWFVPSSGTTWAIYVHGINGDRAAGLRIVPTVRRAGYPSLLISLRNDLGAPRSPDGHINLGMTEWQDLAAAVQYATTHGARAVIVIGYSMGASIAGRFMRESTLAKYVRGLVFDSPVVDWRSAISYAASRYDVPFMARPVEWAVSARIHINWDALDLLDDPKGIGVPVLLFQGLQDQQVPASQSAALAHALPHEVTYEPVPGAGHLESWNADPARYDSVLTAFLRATADD